MQKQTQSQKRVYLDRDLSVTQPVRLKCLAHGGLTCFIYSGTLLVHGGAESGCSNIQKSDLVYSGIKYPEHRVFVIIVVAHDFVINERSKHLSLQES